MVLIEQCTTFVDVVFVVMGPEFKLDYYSKNRILVIDSAGVDKNPLLGNIASQY